MASLSQREPRAIVRKYAGIVPTDTVDLVAVASVDVTSEQELFPIDHVFDGRMGPGGSCWIAETPGPQTIHLRFASASDFARLVIESEERSVTCTQRIEVACWSERRHQRAETAPRVLEYAPYGPSFHQVTWELDERAVTDVWIHVTPMPRSHLASLTSVVFRR
ncbi:hypothetical protein AKJ09_10732 [Labilithrix luteola]|uniref:Uncharacterized protein n=1 Tax=Labilithrix luteola TaxID=1391654 RepID=A0A0K1QE80_9BACT|nr:hypothetical protein [Labilithrix luteola]AKV04069.1 hypothetical protein AKJ09_10732 [Labilithrix luteola]